VVDFGTAVTFDVVNPAGNYAGGIIAPGLAAMTDYLHEKTALLPRIKIREVKRVVGKSTEEAMLAGAVHGYRGLVRGLLQELMRELRVQRLPVVATGGYGELIAAKMPEITAVDPMITLEGLRLTWLAHSGESGHRFRLDAPSAGRSVRLPYLTKTGVDLRKCERRRYGERTTEVRLQRLGSSAPASGIWRKNRVKEPQFN